jgi:hypothetical protein
MGAAKYIESAVQIDIDHGAKTVGGQTQHRRHKIARRSGDDDIQRTELFRRIFKNRPGGGKVAHIAA